MANYTTTTLCKQVLPMLNSVTTVTSADISRAITAAESVMDSKLAKVFTVPVTPTPPVLETLATDLTLYRLLAMRFYTGEQMNKSEWPDRFKEANETLDNIVSGKVALVDSGGTVISQTATETGFWSNTESYNATFTEDDMNNSWPDPDKIDAIRSDRNL